MDIYIYPCCHTLQLQALVYNILPPSTAITGGSLGAEIRGLECAIHGPINYMYMSMLPYTPTPGSGLRHPSIHGHDWRKLGAEKARLGVCHTLQLQASLFWHPSCGGEMRMGLNVVNQSEARFAELGEYSQKMLSEAFWTPSRASSQLTNTQN